MIGLLPFSYKGINFGTVFRKSAGSLTGLAVGDAVIILQVNGGVATIPPLPTGLSSLAETSFNYQVTSNNGNESSNGTSAYRISFGRATASPIPNASTSFRTGDIYSRTGGGTMSMALALSASGTFTPTGLVRPISYVAMSFQAGAASVSSETTTDTLDIGTVNGTAPTVSRFFSTGTIHTISAGVNSRYAFVKIKIGVWEMDFGTAPVTYTAGTAGNQRLLSLSGV